jgi:gamma-glutamyltranspeptidase/glutathione hydrolase
MIETRRPTPRAIALADHGMVATAHPLATAAGLEVLQRGGNAIDAAVATAAVLNVVLPASCGLGGDAFILHHDGRTGSVTGINGSGVVPYAATVEYYRSRGFQFLPEEGIHSVSVPGAVDAYATALERFGSMPLGDLLQPAIRYAEEGFPMTAAARRAMARTERLARFPSTARIFCDERQIAGRVGRLANPDLGRSLRQIAEGGRDAFYRGEIAQAIVRCSQSEGGLFTLQEFADHRSTIYDPIRTEYHGFTVYETSPPSQGMILLEELNLAEGFDLAGMGFGSPACIHTMVEAKKLAFADRWHYAGDPQFVDVPLGRLLSKEYAVERRRQIDPDRAMVRAPAGEIHREGDTTSFVVVDRDRNAVSFIISLSSGFGSGLVAEGTGILLNNRAGLPQGFTLEDGHPDCLAPGKRTMHTLNTYLITREGRLFAVGNTPGGDNQVQWNFQVIVNLLDFGMDPQEAVDAPRWSSFPGANPHTVSQPYVLTLDERFPPETAAELERRGHTVTRGPVNGAVQLIQVDAETGVLLGGSDPRAGGLAAGF